MARRETGLIGRLFNALTESGTTITRTGGFLGPKKTIVKNYDTGVTKVYAHGAKGRAAVEVFRNDSKIAEGNIQRDIYGCSVEKLQYKKGRIKKSVKKMGQGLWGNLDTTKYYDKKGRKVEESKGKQEHGFIFDKYTRSHEAKCFRCNGTGIYAKTGAICQKCGGTGIFKRWTYNK